MIYTLVNLKINEVLDKIKTSKNINEKSSSTSSVISVADELKKFKELLDLGIITLDEFTSKKNKLLNM